MMEGRTRPRLLNPFQIKQALSPPVNTLSACYLATKHNQYQHNLARTEGREREGERQEIAKRTARIASLAFINDGRQGCNFIPSTTS